MVSGVSHTRYATTYDSTDTSGWNGWLYPVLFIVLPVIACLMVLILIACNLYEYYQKKKRLQQYKNYDRSVTSAANMEAPDKRRPEVDQEFEEGVGYDGYNESKYTYNAIFGNYVKTENRVPSRPMSGWVESVEPHM